MDQGLEQPDLMLKLTLLEPALGKMTYSSDKSKYPMNQNGNQILKKIS